MMLQFIVFKKIIEEVIGAGLWEILAFSSTYLGANDCPE